MTARDAHPVYRFFVRLYPREFRREYGEDLAAHYADLVADRGARAARTRTALDLAITIPRYRLEHIMSDRHAATAVTFTIGVLAVGGLVGLATDVYPGLLPLALLALAALLAVAQRSTLARALRVPDSTVRRHRMRTAGVLALIFAASYITFNLVIGDSWTGRETALTIVGLLALLGAVGYFIAGLLTPRTPGRPATHVRSTTP